MSFFSLLDKAPALFYALFASLGLGAVFSPPLILGITGFLATLPYLLKKEFSRPLLGSMVALGFYFYASQAIWHDPIPEEGTEGIAWIHIDHISLQKGESQWVYKGTLLHFFGALEVHNLPFILKLNVKNPRPSADQDYLIQARLFQGFGNHVRLKILDSTWESTGGFSLAEIRYQMKSALGKMLEKSYTSAPALHFLKGLLLGEFEDKDLKEDFSKLGLLHLLAISGFHFTLLAAILRTLITPFFSFRLSCVIIIALLSGYFFLLGWGPSVVRAFISSLLFFTGLASHRRSFGLNVLGSAILTSLLIDPLMIQNVGFQLSVAVTASILLFYSGFKQSLTLLFPKRTIEELEEGPLADHLGYFILSGFRNSLALTLSTLPAALPLSLFYFQQFPWLSLIYNLFFPFFVSINLSLALGGLLLTPLPYVGDMVVRWNDFLTSFFLNMTYEIPESWTLVWKVNEIPAFALIIYFIIVFEVGCRSRKHVLVYNKDK